ncbi:Protein of unknown function DUF128 [Methanohalobium evestigatum Z-7303]|uniref:Uncharacterized protein n=1 Tax=Methanohalobium evestigatum (strain ATCC BAA-1072 / DSM 3721 / NBRC 107634 / OCM 161 / Z-7303) TaxID=644295 RepID=D7E9U3_METEZ|nr:DUF128 domain-containing protein [Methanohalobium evestigatum]ADI74365.1 Protein of unknown function DUF128 [Methanohalobium evestigatum Z-7303]
MTDALIERKLIEIMRIISESDKPVGARSIADELNNRGYGIGERAVRYHLRILDERGFTKKEGYSGRVITELGEKELRDALIGDRLSFVSTRIEELMYRMNFDPETEEGNVIVNISLVDNNDLEDALEIIKIVTANGITISPRIQIFDENSDSKIDVPEGKTAIATVCSITIDGILLNQGVPVEPAYGGTLNIKNNEPVNFQDLISYSGTSIDPIKIFMSRKTTSVLDVLDTGTGKILANMRTIPASASEKALDVINRINASEIGGVIRTGESGEYVFGAPVDFGMSGVPVYVGTNVICAVEEAGIDVATYPVSTVLEYSNMSKL